MDSASNDLPCWLSIRLRQRPPGRRAQRRYAPSLAYGRHFAAAGRPSRPAAVMMLLYPHGGRWHLPLIRRPLHLAEHPGQIALPGGAAEWDETPETTAARETHEELGVRLESPPLGRLTPVHVFQSGFFVTPCIAALRARPTWRANADEVDQLIEMPLAELARRENHVSQMMRHDAAQSRVQPLADVSHDDGDTGWCFSAPCISWHGHHIWGVTAIILGELVTLLEEMPPDKGP